MPILRLPSADIVQLFGPQSLARLHVLKVSPSGMLCYGEAGMVSFLRPDECSNQEWEEVLKIAIRRITEDLNRALKVCSQMGPEVETEHCPECGDPSDQQEAPFCSKSCRRRWRWVG